MTPVGVHLLGTGVLVDAQQDLMGRLQESKLLLSKQEWTYFLAVLNVMKPGFTGCGTPTVDDKS